MPTTVAVDVAKTVFELAIANGQWRVVSRQRLNRGQFTRFLGRVPRGAKRQVTERGPA